MSADPDPGVAAPPRSNRHRDRILLKYNGELLPTAAHSVHYPVSIGTSAARIDDERRRIIAAAEPWGIHRRVVGALLAAGAKR